MERPVIQLCDSEVITWMTVTRVLPIKVGGGKPRASALLVLLYTVRTVLVRNVRPLVYGTGTGNTHARV